jgi:hypothetical protein
MDSVKRETEINTLKAERDRLKAANTELLKRLEAHRILAGEAANVIAELLALAKFIDKCLNEYVLVVNPRHEEEGSEPEMSLIISKVRTTIAKHDKEEG